MAKRKIIKIDELKCNGCGLCIPNCPEGALQIIDGKARLISDLFCDGLGACIGYCPEGAITTEEREAEAYDEQKVMENIVKQGKNTIIAHLKHLKEHNEHEYLKQAMEVLKQKNIEVPFEADLSASGPLPCGCPGSNVKDFRGKKSAGKKQKSHSKQESQLQQWPVQIMLVPAFAPYLKEADLLIAADCVPFAYADFHNDLLKDKVLLVGCPKLDDISVYQEKFTQILKNNDLKSITYVRMELPCCFGMVPAVKNAIAASGKKVPFSEIVISIKGEKIK
ncbi:MAG: 4Fe-4S binding protein [Candidatus Omnitrophota bacterium]